MEDLVDRTVHPPKKRLRVTAPGEDLVRLPWPARAALVLLAVFWVSVPLAGFLVAEAAGGLAGLALASLVVAYLLGSE